jgi:hypothetical protein
VTAMSFVIPAVLSVLAFLPDARAANPSGSDYHPGQRFRIEEYGSYFGINDSLLGVNCDQKDSVIDLVLSPQDFSTAAYGGEPIGYFRAAVSSSLCAKIGGLLPGLLSPMPVATGHVSPGDPPVLDAPSSGVTVESGATKWLLRAPATHDVSTELDQLLAGARIEVKGHPVAAIRLSVRKDKDSVVFEMQNVGSAPVSLTNPLSDAGRETGLFLVKWRAPTPGLTQEPPTKSALSFRERPAVRGTQVILKPGGRFVLHSALPNLARLRDQPGQCVGVEARWIDRGEADRSGPVFRVRGALLSSVLVVAPCEPTSGAR